MAAKKFKTSYGVVRVSAKQFVLYRTLEGAGLLGVLSSNSKPELESIAAAIELHDDTPAAVISTKFDTLELGRKHYLVRGAVGEKDGYIVIGHATDEGELREVLRRMGVTTSLKEVA